MSEKINMLRKRYASITAIKPAGRCSSGDRKWLFECDCGSRFKANGYYARTSKITTCPTCAAERTRLASVKHGLSDTPEFSTWTDIKTRCYNTNIKAFKDYGGRGIRVCDRWLSSFDDFLVDMGKRPSKNHSIDRINNDGNYEPGNCRWATRKEQAVNKRNTVVVEIDGVIKNLQEWSREYDITPSTIYLRIRAGVTGTALLASSKRDGCVEYGGITDTYAGWSKRTGIKQSTIAMRLTAYMWPVERALTKGATL